MVLDKIPPCKFFAQGLCRSGNSCRFVHEAHASTLNHFGSVDPVSSTIEKLSINPAVAIEPSSETKLAVVCRFFIKGSCDRGRLCRYLHPSPTALATDVSAGTISLGGLPSQQCEESPRTILDSRSSIRCKFLPTSKGCQNDSCPYLHSIESHQAEEAGYPALDAVDEEDPDLDDDSARSLSGAVVSFDELGHVTKVSLPTDFSLARISGLAQGATPETIVKILRDIHLNINTDCVRISKNAVLSETNATVKVEDPFFAKELCARVKTSRLGLTAVALPIDTRWTDRRKVYISWHKATRSVWVNYGNEEIANRVAQKFNNGRYKCLGQAVKCSIAKRSSSRRPNSYNPLAWTITLSDVPSHATTKDIDEAIIPSYDKPRHIERGSISYLVSDPEVSLEVLAFLEKYGRLENFHLSPATKGKRVRATARFLEEVDARSACSLNNNRLNILNGGRLTVSLVQSAKVKVQTTIYCALKGRIDNARKIWADRHVAFHVYPESSTGYTTLKLEGDIEKEISYARKKLNEILSGIVLKDGDNAVWSPTLNTNGSSHKKLKLIAKELDIVLHRDKSKCQLRFCGSPEKYPLAVVQITQMLKEETSTSYEIDLKSDKFSWMVQGGFKCIELALGKDVAIFNVVSKKVTIIGTEQNYHTALAIMDEKSVVKSRSLSDGPSLQKGDCPICFCEADNPKQTSCMHTYCTECFEDLCKSAAATSQQKFQVKCQGNEGTCSTSFSRRELKKHLSSSVYETLLESSFGEYIQRHAQTFRYCPIPDCGYIYRCSPSSDMKAQAYNCPNCFETTCTSCHSRHGTYTCAEYKDIASGGYEALARLKRELNVKDCPKCTTPMEKTEGCNHMTCGGCKAHICWVCMAVFETSGPCYAHMNKEHGGIGLGAQHLGDG